MRQQQRGQLGQVEIAASPQPENAIDPHLACPLGTFDTEVQWGFGKSPVKDLDGPPGGSTVCGDTLDHSGPDEHRIGHDQQSLDSQSIENLGEAFDRTRAKDEFARCVKCPGGAHGGQIGEGTAPSRESHRRADLFGKGGSGQDFGEHSRIVGRPDESILQTLVGE